MGISRSKLARLGGFVKSWHAGATAFGVLLIAIAYKAYIGSERDSLSKELASTEFIELSGGHLPRYSIFTSSFVSSILPLTFFAIVLAMLTFRLSKAIARSKKASLLVNSDHESGSSAVEFVLVMPPLLALLLMIFQIALLVQAKFVVNYAAFCAARSAIVIIPDEFPGGGGVPAEGRNQLATPERSEKFEIIRHAASLPLTAISPLPGWRPATGSPLLTNLDDASHLLLLAPFDVTPRSMMAQAIIRGPYAYDDNNTALTIITPQGERGGSFKEHDFVTVRVTYRYYLVVPFAKKLFGTAYSGNPFINIIFGTDYYYPVVEQYTLPMDGEPIKP